MFVILFKMVLDDLIFFRVNAILYIVRQLLNFLLNRFTTRKMILTGWFGLTGKDVL